MSERRFTAEDVADARAQLELHTPTQIEGQLVCCSAVHLIVPPAWPCAQRVWAKEVLEAQARGEIESSSFSAEVVSDDVAP